MTVANPSKQVFEQQVLPLFEEHRAAWLAKARATAERLAQGGQIITSDMVRAECPLPEGMNPNVMGAIFRPLKKWKKLGYIESHRMAAHGRVVGKFVLNEAYEQGGENGRKD